MESTFYGQMEEPYHYNDERNSGESDSKLVHYLILNGSLIDKAPDKDSYSNTKFNNKLLVQISYFHTREFTWHNDNRNNKYSAVFNSPIWGLFP